MSLSSLNLFSERDNSRHLEEIHPSGKGKATKSLCCPDEGGDLGPTKVHTLEEVFVSAFEVKCRFQLYGMLDESKSLVVVHVTIAELVEGSQCVFIPAKPDHLPR